MEIDLKGLHPLEVKLLRHVNHGDTVTAGRIVDDLGFKLGQCNQAFSWLTAKGLLSETGRTVSVFYELTELGEEYAVRGTPADRILTVLKESGSLPMNGLAEAAGLEQRDVGSAYGILAKEGALRMDGDKKVCLVEGAAPRFLATLRELIRKAGTGAIAESELSSTEIETIAGYSRKRGASGAPFKTAEREEVSYTLTNEGAAVKKALESAGVTGEEIGALTPEVLSSGAWREGSFRAYNIQAPAARLIPGRRNPYVQYIEGVKDKLVSLGFEEFDGPVVETEFWNGDALFMPQFHSARDIHDVYYLRNPSHAREIEQPWLDQVAAAHENGWKTGSRGWGYTFDREFTRRLVLRSQGTVLSAKQLTKAAIPGKYFGIVRCFRYDQIDATHGADFYQTEGIVLGEEVNLKTLLGLLRMFAEEVAGATDVRYVPGYFPFTEPSIEVHIKHPELGWFELGGSGIFRPEVTESLGVNVPVLAWGLGIDRMALMQLGLRDMRDLFTNDIEQVRLRRRNS